jgi:hypothetical protein
MLSLDHEKMFLISYSKSIVNYLVFRSYVQNNLLLTISYINSRTDLLFHQQDQSISPAAAKGHRYPARKRSSDPSPIDDMKIALAQTEQQPTMAPKGVGPE